MRAIHDDVVEGSLLYARSQLPPAFHGLDGRVAWEELRRPGGAG